MFSTTFKTIITTLMLGLLTLSAFFIRLENFKKSQMRSIDEIVYYRMGKQIAEEGLSGYNTIPYGRELAARGRELPDYFFAPLFKHPPVFSFLLSFSMRIFGKSMTSAAYVPLLCGVFLIPLCYILGRLIFNWKVGLFAAIFMWIDPVSMICSQKVWMGTTISFFTLISITCFTYGLLKAKKDIFFIFGGMACGLAVLTKYTGILPTIIIVTFARLYQPELFKNKKFVSSLFIPFLFLIPWVLWNWKVYKLQTFDTMFNKLNPHFAKLLQQFDVILILPVIIVIIALILLYKKLTEEDTEESLNISKNEDKPNLLKNILPFTLTGVLLFLLREQIFLGFQFDYLPKVSWGNFGFRDGNPAFFYFTQLAKFSMIYIAGFLSLLIGNKNSSLPKSFLRLSAIIILVFFILWGNYQSRYIIQAVPILIVLASSFLIKLFDMASTKEAFLLRVIYKSLIILFLICTLTKTYYLNLVLSYSHDFCYF